MNCDDCRAVLSADLDAEATPGERRDAEAHAADCAGCGRHALQLADLHRALRVRPAESVPDLSAAILSRAHPPRTGRWEWIRAALAVVAATELVLAVPALLGDTIGADTHTARHVGSLSAALAVGFLYAALRPVRAYGLLPIALALAGTIVVTAAVDIAAGNASTLGEAHHVLDLAAVILLWLLAGRPTRGVGRRARLRLSAPR